MCWLILRRGVAQLATGLAIGIVGALLLGATLERMLMNILPVAPVTLLAVVVTLTLVAQLVCIVPALRAMRVDSVDPVVALRADAL